MRRVGWHLDDVPQPFLTFRRLAFALIVLCFVVGAGGGGFLLAYDSAHHRSTTLPEFLVGGAILAGAIAGVVFGWTNTKSPRWRQWRTTMAGPLPDSRADGQDQ